MKFNKNNTSLILILISLFCLNNCTDSDNIANEQINEGENIVEKFGQLSLSGTKHC